MTDVEFIDQVQQIFHHLADYCENYLNENVEVDLYEETLEIISDENQIWLINRHLATHEIWLSSPLTGGHHFGWHENSEQWITNRFPKESIQNLLKNEFLKSNLSKM